MVDTSNNWRYPINPETVTYQVKLSHTLYDSGTEIESAKRFNVHKQDQDNLTTQELVWHLWKAKLGTIVPKRGDAIYISAMESWIVQRVQLQSFGQKYRVECQRAIRPVPTTTTTPAPDGVQNGYFGNFPDNSGLIEVVLL